MFWIMTALAVWGWLQYIKIRHEAVKALREIKGENNYLRQANHTLQLQLAAASRWSNHE